MVSLFLRKNGTVPILGMFLAVKKPEVIFMKKLFFVVGLVLVAVLLVTNFSFAQGEKKVIAVGRAAGNSLQSRDSALNRALRNAIEQGVGTLVDSETMVQNFQLLDDKIYSDVKGYVKEYTMLYDNGGKGGVYEVKIEAIVALARLTKDVKGLGIIKDKKGNPRIMILFSEQIDGVPIQGQLAQTEMEKIFLKNNFPVIDKAQFKAVKSRDVTLSYADPQKAAALGQRYGAEVVIVGEASSDFAGKSMPYGVDMFTYESQVSAKAIRVDTAELMVSDNIGAIERGGSRNPSARKALAKAGKALAGKILNQVVERWRSDVFNFNRMQIVVDGINNDSRDMLKTVLEAKRDIKRVDERSFINNVLILDVEMLGDTDQLAALLGELGSFNLEVTGKTDNRVDVKLLPNFYMQAPPVGEDSN